MDIFIVPVKFSNVNLLKNLTDELTKRFFCKTNILDLSIDIDKFFSEERGQYFSTQIIAELMNITGELNGKVIMLTDVDIYVPVLTFIFGEAQLNGKHSIVSVCRLHEEFYSGESNNSLLLQRTIKEVLHELGHNYGLLHCLNWDCVMHSSPGIEEVDIKGNTFCRTCASKIENFKY
jgi:archaemetzincin